MNSVNLMDLTTTTNELFQKSNAMFWMILPIALLTALLGIYLGGEVSGAKLETLFRRLLIAIALLVAFPQISRAIQGMEGYLIQNFGGEQSLAQVFLKLGERASQFKDEGTLNWLKVGQIGLNVITTLSFLILALIRHFLDVLHLALWNLLHVLGPLSLLGCLFTSWVQVPKGVFVAMLELSLWKPVWVVLARILISVGFGEPPKDASLWFDTAVLNFTVAGLMAYTPILVHSFLAGTLGSTGGMILQTMATGAGAMLSAQPMRIIQAGSQWTSRTINQNAHKTFRSVTSRLNKPSPKPSNPNNEGKRGK